MVDEIVTIPPFATFEEAIKGRPWIIINEKEVLRANPMYRLQP